jgi:hypothetical protein
MAQAEATPSKEEKRREVEWRELDQLLLDNKNPRLPDGDLLPENCSTRHESQLG